MLRSIQQITEQLISDIPGHIFKMKYISEENKLLIYENKKVYATIGDKEKKVIYQMFNEEFYQKIKTKILSELR